MNNKKIKILHLEDVKSHADLVEFALRKLDVEIETLVVDTRAEFSHTLKSFIPDIIISDHSLPSFTSYEALDICQKMGVSIPFIVVTANTSEELAVDIIKKGADDYILKDNLESLPAAVIKSLAKYRLQKKQEIYFNTLQKNEKHYRTLVENGADAILILNITGWPLYVSASIERILGYSEKEALQLNVYKLLHPQDRDDVGKIMAKCVESPGVPLEVSSSRVIHKDGKYRWIKATLTNMMHDPAINGIVNHFHDITDKKLADEKLISTLADLNKIMDSSLDVICSINKEGFFITASAATERLWGYTPQELIGTKYLDLVYKDDMEATIITTGRIVNGSQVPLFENRYVHKNGNIVPMLWSINWDENTQIMFCVAKDVTEQKLLEKAIENERDRFSNMFSLAPASIGVLKGPNHVFQMANDLYLDLTARKDIVGKTVREVFPELGNQVFFDTLDKVYSSGYTFTAREEPVRLDRAGTGELTQLYLNFVYQPYRNKQNVIEGIFFFIIDVTEQVVLRKNIERSEKRYREIIDTAQEGIWLIDDKNITTFVNKKICDIFEYTPEEMLGKDFYSFMIEEEKPDTPERIEENSSDKIYNYNTLFFTKYKKSIWTNISVKPIFEDNGIFKGSLVMVSDITEKKKLEDLLDKANKLARIGSYEIDLVKHTQYWSAITRQIHKVESDFMPDMEMLHNFYKAGESREIIYAAIENAVIKNEPFDVEVQIITAKGKECWVKVMGETEFINNICTRVYGSFQDIDARKKLELEAINAFEEKNIILESIGDAFFAVNKNWIVTYWNNQAEKILLGPKTNIIGKNLWDVFADSINSVSFKKYAEAIDSNKVVNFEDYYQHLDKWFEVSAYPSVNGLSVFFKDITERKQSQTLLHEMNETLLKSAKELALSNSELEQFAYVASHDLQEPLRMITSFLTLIEKKYNNVLDDKGRKYIEFAVDGGKRMRQIILDLLEFSRIGKTEDKKEDIDLNELVDEILTLHSNQIEEEKAIIHIDNLPILKSFKTPLRQVFQNLINNGLKYHKDGMSPEIFIKAESLDDCWLFTIEDNGIGIKNEYLEKIFVIFQRLHNRDKYSGTGIGLAITRKIVESMGGEIFVESKEGDGSKFSFTIPKEMNAAGINE